MIRSFLTGKNALVKIYLMPVLASTRLYKSTCSAVQLGHEEQVYTLLG